MSWKNVIDNARGVYFNNKLVQISDSLLEKIHSNKENINLTGGQAGIALFFFYYGLLTKDKEYTDKGFDILTDVIDKIGKGSNFVSFAGGLAGVGWVVEHLVQHNFIRSDTNNVLEELDILMYENMMMEIRKGDYNYLHHALGMGLYFLGRIKHGKAKEYLTHLITELEFISVKKDNGAICWNSVIDRENDTSGVNLGLSHGMAGIILFLSLLYENGIQSARVARMMNGAVKFILNNQLDRNSKSVFPNWVVDGKDPVFSRLAWSYGDLGIAFSLWRAAYVTGNKEWKKKSIQIFERSSRRENLLENAIVDSSLCHGTSGIALIYQRMYNYTGIEVFRKSAIYWLDETLKMSKHDDGLAGYLMWNGTEEGEWKQQMGMLNGIAGVGLTLISTVSEIEPAWDRSLLLS